MTPTSTHLQNAPDTSSPRGGVVPRQRSGDGSASMAIAVARRALGSVIVVTASGELDLRTVPELEQRLDELLRTANFHRLVLDLGDLRFFGAVGLSCLLSAQDTAAQAEIRLSVVPGSGFAARVLHLSTVAAEIDIAATVDAACGPVPATTSA